MTKTKLRRVFRNSNGDCTDTNANQTEQRTKLFVKSGTATLLLGIFKNKHRAQAAASMIKDTIIAYDGTCEASFLFAK